MSATAVYRRLGEIIVVPQGGGGGHFIDIEPIEVVPPDEASVQAAVERALQVSSRNADGDTPPRGWRSPLLGRYGVKSYKAFMKDALLCFVFEDASDIDVERWVPARDGRGFEPAPGGGVRLRGRDGLGELVLRALGTA